MLFLIAKFETKHCNMYLILGYLRSKECLKKHCIPVVKYMHSVSLSSHVQLATPHCSLPGSSVHGILQPRILEQVAIPFSRGSAGRFFIFWATREAPNICLVFIKLCYLTFFFLANHLATWLKEPTHWKRPWCWETLNANGKWGSRGWEG